MAVRATVLGLTVSICLGVSRAADAALPELTPSAVARALEGGAAYLAGVLADPEQVPEYGYPLGARALFCAALASVGRKEDAPLVARLFARIETMQLENVYCVSLYVIAIDAHIKRQGERARPSSATRTTLTRLVNWLVRAQGSQHGGWSYGRTNRGSMYDLSNTQFAMLALHAAHRWGIPVPRRCLEAMADTCIQRAMPEGPEHETEIAPAIDVTHAGAPARPRVVNGIPMGWPYGPRSSSAYFAMTAATIGNLIAAEAMLGRQGGAWSEAADRGLLWLDRHWNELTRRHARPGIRLTSNLYYTLWSLEKTCDLGGLARIGGRDWYGEGARYLLGAQNADGSWSQGDLAPVATSFVLLFLSRAASASPVLSAAPSLFTGPGSGTDRDRVFIRRLGGYLSARTYLTFVAARRDPRLLALAAEVVGAYPPDAREDLVVPLRELLATGESALVAFARGALQDVTGLTRVDLQAVDAWLALLERVRALEAARDGRGLGELAGEAWRGSIWERYLQAVERLRDPACIPPLAGWFASAPSECRPRLHRALCHLTGRREEYAKGVSEVLWKRVAAGGDGTER